MRRPRVPALAAPCGSTTPPLALLSCLRHQHIGGDDAHDGAPGSFFSASPSYTTHLNLRDLARGEEPSESAGRYPSDEESFFTPADEEHEQNRGGSGGRGRPPHPAPRRVLMASQPGYREALAKLLPDIPHGLPTSPGFAIERLSGEEAKRWVTALLPDLQQAARRSTYLYEKDVFWQLPAYHALAEVVHRQPYSKSLGMIMEHGYFFLFEKEIFLSPDAPLPHIMYEDMQRALTFASLQKPPEEQFQLSTTILVRLLCLAAYHCTLDPHYFTAAENLLFKKMEQQQHVNAEVMSAFIFVCVAGGKVGKALAMAEWMSAQRQCHFSPRVFAAMMHPSLSPIHLLSGIAPHAAKGILLQERLCESLNSSIPQGHDDSFDGVQLGRMSTTSVVVHAAFVHYALTLRHPQKWELVRAAMCDLVRASGSPHATGRPTRTGESGVLSSIALAPRTRELILETYAKEKGVRCGPEATRAVLALALHPAQANTSDDYGNGGGVTESMAKALGDALFVLLRTRRNEVTPVFASTLALPVTAFTEEEKQAVMGTVVMAMRAEAGRRKRPSSRAMMDSPTETIVKTMRFLLDMDDGGGDVYSDINNGNSNKHGSAGCAVVPAQGRYQQQQQQEEEAARFAELRETGRREREGKMKEVLRAISRVAATTTANVSETRKRQQQQHQQLSVSSSSPPAVAGAGGSAATSHSDRVPPVDVDVGQVILARLRFLDQMSASPPSPTTAAAHGSSPKETAGDGVLSPPFEQWERTRQQQRTTMEEKLQDFLLSSEQTADSSRASSPAVMDAFPGGISPAGLDGDQKAWAAKVMKDEAETAMLRQELHITAAKYL